MKKIVFFLAVIGSACGLVVLGSSSAAVSVRLISPNGGETWIGGETKAITWSVADGAGAGVAIFYSTDAGVTTELIAKLEGNPASFAWTVPRVESKACLVVVEVTDARGGTARDQSDAVFSITKSEPKPDLAAEIETSKKETFLESFTITVTIKNTGTAPSPETVCEVMVRNGHSPRQILRRFEKKIREIDAGGSYSYASPLKVGRGLFEICAVVDPGKKIDEKDKANNRACLEIAGK